MNENNYFYFNFKKTIITKIKLQVKIVNIKNNDYISNSKYSLDLDTLNKINK
jgi:hypothetical protein